MSTVLDRRAHPETARLSRPFLRLTTAMLVLDSAVLGGRVSVVWSSSLVGRTIGENGGLPGLDETDLVGGVGLYRLTRP
jgi:hypothetical protein